MQTWEKINLLTNSVKKNKVKLIKQDTGKGKVYIMGNLWQIGSFSVYSLKNGTFKFYTIPYEYQN